KQPSLLAVIQRNMIICMPWSMNDFPTVMFCKKRIAEAFRMKRFSLPPKQMPIQREFRLLLAYFYTRFMHINVQLLVHFEPVRKAGVVFLVMRQNNMFHLPFLKNRNKIIRAFRRPCINQQSINQKNRNKQFLPAKGYSELCLH